MAEPTRPQNDARAAAIQAALAELRAEYAEGLSTLVAELAAAVEAACGSAGGADIRHLQTLAHRMHGAAGSYGFKGVSAAAARMEVLLSEREDGRAAFDDATRALVRASLDDIRDTAQRELAEFGGDGGAAGAP